MHKVWMTNKGIDGRKWLHPYRGCKTLYEWCSYDAEFQHQPEDGDTPESAGPPITIDIFRNPTHTEDTHDHIMNKHGFPNFF